MFNKQKNTEKNKKINKAQRQGMTVGFDVRGMNSLYDWNV